MDHHPNRTRTRAARQADSGGPDYTTAWLAGKAAGASDAEMEAYIEAAEEAHAVDTGADRSDEGAQSS